ncbi:MAG: DUF1800 domain-containing protein [Acidimicrobiia bacterium]|nr:DUF1800 domain-containing protein [Acidimicrobiia bacterium]
MVSDNERISHICRRLGYGAQPDMVATVGSADAARDALLDLSAPADASFRLDPPDEFDPETDRGNLIALLSFWLEQLATSPRRIEERLVWFWHDHFATDVRKVQTSYFMYLQHQTIRRHATGSFRDLLHAIAVDPAMLVYLDGAQNTADAINENFGREVMELFTLGRGHYTEDDVVAASRAFSGWVAIRDGSRARRPVDLDPWTSHFIPIRHDSGAKTLLGTTGRLDAVDAIDILLEQERTAEFIAHKLYVHLVGLEPATDELDRISTAFRADYDTMDLVTAIAAEPAFTSDAAVLAKVRTPLEKAVGVVQAFGGERGRLRSLGDTLRTMGYVPLAPPNVAGYPEGPALLDPHRLVHTFDFSVLIPEDVRGMSPVEIMNRLGIYDISPNTHDVLESVPDTGGRIAMAINSPEYHLV